MCAAQSGSAARGHAHRLMVVLLLGAALLVLPLRPAGGENWRRFPAPIGELEKVISDWLKGAGFEIEHSTFEMGGLQMVARKEAARWDIRLRPDSPLAAQYLAVYSRDGQPDAGQAAAGLARYLEGYLQYTPAPAAGTRADKEIPPAVLGRIASVVCLRAATAEGATQLSGLVVDQGGLILCVAHAIDASGAITVQLYDGSTLAGRAVKMDRRRDLALVRVAGSLPEAVSPATGRRLVGMGERLYSLGCPRNLGVTVHQGTVNGAPRRVQGQPLWMVDMPIHPGSSGSPVFDTQGNLVALVKGRYRGTDNLGFLIPIETILAFLNL